MREIIVKAASKESKILIGHDITIKCMTDFLHQRWLSRFIVVTENNVVNSLPKRLEEYFPEGVTLEKIIIQEGEKNKTMDSLLQVLLRLSDLSVRRDEAVIALGGGVVGDLAGFAAAIYLRGISLVQIPTSLLAMVDSSVGGKTGVNLPKAKNSVGAFKQPDLTIIDPSFLSSLSHRDFVSGAAEIVKHALILDEKLFKTIEKNPISREMIGNHELENILFESCCIKAGVVERDETEVSERMLLNFGHTMGHFIETVTGYNKYRHGEAIFAGMEFAAHISRLRNKLNQEDLKLVQNVISSYVSSIEIPNMNETEIAEVLHRDKKSRVDGIRFVVLQQIGKANIGHFSIDEVADAFLFFVRNNSKIIKMV